MGIFHKLQDVYYDTLQLAAEIKRIPPDCDCGDGDAHLDGRCCCAHGKAATAWVGPGKGCLARLDSLSKVLRSLDDDLRRESRTIEPPEDSRELEGQLSLITSVAYQLSSEIGRVQDDLTEFRQKCAADVLQRIKKRGASLQRYAARLNTLL